MPDPDRCGNSARDQSFSGSVRHRFEPARLAIEKASVTDRSGSSAAAAASPNLKGDEGFIATAPDLPGCSAFGETEHEALAELDDAIIAWISAARAAGNVAPKPSKPSANKVFSGLRG